MKTVLITNNNLNSLLSLNQFIGIYGHFIDLIVVTTKLPGSKSNISGVLKMLHRSGFYYCFFKILINVILPIYLKFRGYPVSVSDGIKLCRLSPKIVACESANLSWVKNEIKSIAPAILITAGATHILDNELLSIPSHAAINLHSSLLPAYAGTAPYFWFLYNLDSLAGATLHIMEPKLDAGPILDQRSFDLKPIDTVLQAMSKIWDINNALLIDFFRSGCSVESTRVQDLSKRSYYREPKKKDVKELLKRGKRLYTIADIKHLLKLVRQIPRQIKLNRAEPI